MNNICIKGTFCDALEERCQTMRPGGIKGLVKMPLTPTSLEEDAGSVVVYHTGRSSKGLALNYCPFCGYSFHYERQLERARGGSNG